MHLKLRSKAENGSMVDRFSTQENDRSRGSFGTRCKAGALWPLTGRRRFDDYHAALKFFILGQSKGPADLERLEAPKVGLSRVYQCIDAASDSCSAPDCGQL
jgi:hypothetical protein